MPQILRQPAAQIMLLDGSQYQTFVILMGTSVTNLTMKNVVPGLLYTFVMQQDRHGNHRIVWGNEFANGMPLDPLPYAVTVQTFVGMQGNSLEASVAGTWTEGERPL